MKSRVYLFPFQDVHRKLKTIGEWTLLVI